MLARGILYSKAGVTSTSAKSQLLALQTEHGKTHSEVSSVASRLFVHGIHPIFKMPNDAVTVGKTSYVALTFTPFEVFFGKPSLQRLPPAHLLCSSVAFKPARE